MLLTWDKPNERYFEHGVDRGVLYLTGKDPVPWNGITGFDEGASGATAMYYRDGQIYLSDASASDFSGKLTALFFPNEFHEALGMPEATDGLYVDNQKPKRFGFSYRTLIGSGGSGDLFGYQIHMVHNAMASIDPRSRRTIGSDATPVEFAFNIVCTPVKMTGYRPTAHYIVDTRNMSASTVQKIEDKLYGSGTTPGVLPTPDELYEMMHYGDNIIVIDHGDGTFTIEGAAKNIKMLDSKHWQVDNINSTAPDTNGHYVISDGGNTSIVSD